MLSHHHHHGHGPDDSHPHDGAGSGRAARGGPALRFGAAGLVIAILIAAACLVIVPAGEALVITRLGDPVRVLTTPGLHAKLPVPLETTTLVDLRLRTMTSGFQDVGTRDGLRVLTQAYVAWQVADDPERVRLYLRSVQNDPDEAARQLRSFLASALEVTLSDFDLAALVNTDPTRLEYDRLESRLQEQLAARALEVYGIAVVQVGLERLTLPATTLAATVARMRAEREIVATERTGQGQRQAAEIRAAADRDARQVGARSREEAAAVEAEARQQAAEIYANAYRTNPELYTMLRSFDTLEHIVGGNTRLILRTDAPPFRVFVEGPDEAAAGAGSKPAAVSPRPPVKP